MKSLQVLLSEDKMKQRLQEVVGENAPFFISQIIQIATNDTLLARCENPMTIVNAALTASMLGLSLDKQHGEAYIVPYKGKAAFQMGYLGWYKLALESEKYKAINCIPVKESNFISWNPFEEKIEVDITVPQQGPTVGYYGNFTLLNGFEKKVYWTVGEMKEHANRYAPSINNGNSLWNNPYEVDKMGTKTVLAHMIRKWGYKSPKIHKAINADNSIQKTEGEYESIANLPALGDGLKNADVEKEKARLLSFIKKAATHEQLLTVRESAIQIGAMDEYLQKEEEMLNL